MKRLIGTLAVASMAFAGFAATAPAASADAGGRCSAYIDVSCTFWNGYYWEQCDLWWGGGCFIDVR